MPSPFPGMNPYFEQPGVWRGFHNTFVMQLAFALTPHVVPRYYVEIEESVYVDDAPRRQVFAVADAAVAAPPDSPEGAGTGVVGTAAPVTATVPVRRGVRRKRRWLTIRDRKGRVIVTVVELLSPSDKRPGPDRDRYLAKRGRVLESRAHLVEIDLLRGGQRTPIERLPTCDYCVMVSRRRDRPRVGVWPVVLRGPLPDIPIPLRHGEPEPRVSLKAVLDQVYDGVGYGYRIYDGPPDPPLSPGDAEWAKAFLPPAG